MIKQDSTTTRREFVKRVATAAAGATLFIEQNTFSAYAESMQEGRQSHPSAAGINVLLVHGAFVDASSWSKVIPLLQARGYNALAVQIPLTSFQEDVTTAKQALASLSGPTILVGHSYGGSVISNVGFTSSNVLSLVYIAAYAPEAGENAQSINARFSPPPLGKHLVPSYRSGFIWIDPVAFPQNFIQDVASEEARALAVAQKPIAPGWHLETGAILVSGLHTGSGDQSRCRAVHGQENESHHP
jgi:pimeloyl-ACP methyl ester carboxylesterase